MTIAGGYSALKKLHYHDHLMMMMIEKRNGEVYIVRRLTAEVYQGLEILLRSNNLRNQKHSSDTT